MEPGRMASSSVVKGCQNSEGFAMRRYAATSVPGEM